MLSRVTKLEASSASKEKVAALEAQVASKEKVAALEAQVASIAEIAGLKAENVSLKSFINRKASIAGGKASREEPSTATLSKGSGGGNGVVNKEAS